MTSDCAIHFFPEAFGSSDARVFGRESANRGFLNAFFGRGADHALYCCTPAAEYFDEFQRRATQAGSSAQSVWISYSQLHGLAEVGCLYQPDPCIAELAWHRRRFGAAAFSLCGVTHTLCSRVIMDAIGALAVAPLEQSYADTAFALDGAQLYSIGFDTSTPGLKSGTVFVNSNSFAAENASFSFPISFTVIVPEPATLTMLLLGAPLWHWFGRRRPLSRRRA